MHTAGRSEWSAFGTTAVLCTTDPCRDDVARRAVHATLADINRTCNRFDPHSELSHVNAMSGRRVRISAQLTRALRVALTVAAETDGSVDPTVGASLEAAGYDRDFAAIGASDAPPSYVPAAGWQSVELDENGQTVRVPRGVKLDLGSTGKALAVDMAAKAAAAASGCGVLFGLGGDLAVAGPAPAGGWPIHVTDDHAAEASAPGQTVVIESGALATSSTLVRRWRRRDDVHHIIDPATGAPASEIWCTVSVAAANCVDANAQATAALVRGDRALERLSALQVPARLRSRSGRVHHIGNWPKDGDTQCGRGI
jgi:FAD:protein FMN transferase